MSRIRAALQTPRTPSPTTQPPCRLTHRANRGGSHHSRRGAVFADASTTRSAEKQTRENTCGRIVPVSGTHGPREDGEDDERGAQPLPMNPLAQRDTYEKQRTDRESGLENDETKRTSSSSDEAHPHLREPLVIDPRLVRRERRAVHGGNPAGIDDVLAEPHVPPQVSVGRGLDDDDQKRSEPGSANESPGGQLTTRMHARNLRADPLHRTTAKNVCPNQDRVASATGWGPEVLADARRL